MGQILKLMADQLVCFDYNYVNYNHSHSHRYYGEHSEERSDEQGDQALPDLSEWPPELSLEVLKNLNATDLSLAGCVWTELARDQVLWHSLSCSQWGYVSIYLKAKSDNFSYHKLYLQLDEGSVTFNADCHMGMDYFFRHGLLDNNPAEIASFFLAAKPLDKSQMRRYLKSRPEVLDQVIDSQNFSNQFLAQALRHLFALVEAPDKRDHYLHLMLDKFAHRFSNCNPQLGLNPDVVYVLCFSLIMLSVDLSSPHIKNKMSKREFIRNVRHAIHRVDDELYGHLYDDIYLKGHIAVT